MVLTKMAKMTNAHFVHKNNGVAPQALENDENDKKMARLACVTHARALFAENPVSAPQIRRVKEIDFVHLGRESPKSLLRHANPSSYRRKQPQIGLRTVQEIVWCSGAEGSKPPVVLCSSTFGHFGCLDGSARPAESQCKGSSFKIINLRPEPPPTRGSKPRGPESQKKSSPKIGTRRTGPILPKNLI